MGAFKEPISGAYGNVCKWKMQISTESFLHLQPPRPALGEHFLPLDRKDGNSSPSQKQASGWRSEVAACCSGGSPPGSLSPTARTSLLPFLRMGSPLLPQPQVALSTLSHSFLVQHTLIHAQIHTNVYTSILIWTLICAHTLIFAYSHSYTLPHVHLYVHIFVCAFALTP